MPMPTCSRVGGRTNMRTVLQVRYSYFVTPLLLLLGVCVVDGSLMLPSQDMSELDSMATTIGTSFEEGRSHSSKLFLPPLASNAQNRLTRYHYFCTPPTIEQLQSVFNFSDDDDNNDHDNYDDGTGRTLLVRRGVCSFEAKARAATALNKQYRELRLQTSLLAGQQFNNGTTFDDFNIMKSGSVGNIPLIRYLVVYDNRPVVLSNLVQINVINKTGIDDLQMHFITTTGGHQLHKIIHDLTYGDTMDEDNNGNPEGEEAYDFPGLPLLLSSKLPGIAGPTDADSHQHGDDPQYNNDDHHRNGWIKRHTTMPQSVQVLRLVLIVLLILFPVGRFCILWYAAGGRIRCTRSGGFQYIPPNARWLSRSLGVGGPDHNADDVADTLRKEQVMSLPEVEYEGGETEEEEHDNEEGRKGVVDHNDHKLNTTTTADTDELTTNDDDGCDDIERGVRIITPSESCAHTNTTTTTTTTDNHKNDGSSSPFSPFANSCTSCSICLDDYEVGERLRLLPCRHAFHTECILPWLTERQGCCPLCKTAVVDSAGDIIPTIATRTTTVVATTTTPTTPPFFGSTTTTEDDDEWRRNTDRLEEDTTTVVATDMVTTVTTSTNVVEDSGSRNNQDTSTSENSLSHGVCLPVKIQKHETNRI